MTTKQNEETLAALNAAVEAAVNARTKWLDRKVAKQAPVPVGGELWNTQTGERLGIVTAHKRWHRGHAEFDTSTNFYYEYEVGHAGSRMIDNTSRHYVSPGTKEQAARVAEGRAACLQR